MAKTIKRITESQLRSIVTESVRRIMAEGCFGGDCTPEDVMDELSKARGNGFDMSDYVDQDGNPAGYYGIEYDPETNKLYAGTIANAGMFHDVEVEYDLSQDLDYNLQGLYEALIDHLMEEGYQPEE